MTEWNHPRMDPDASQPEVLDAEPQVGLDVERQVGLDAEQQVGRGELLLEAHDAVPLAVHDGEHGRSEQSQQEPNLLFPMSVSCFFCST